MQAAIPISMLISRILLKASYRLWSRTLTTPAPSLRLTANPWSARPVICRPARSPLRDTQPGTPAACERAAPASHEPGGRVQGLLPTMTWCACDLQSISAMRLWRAPPLWLRRAVWGGGDCVRACVRALWLKGWRAIGRACG